MSFKPRSLNRIAVVLSIALLSISVHATDDKSKHNKAAVGAPIIWKQQADIASLNLLLGPGGEGMEPDTSRITFISEEKKGYSKKYRVRDGSGREWVAKIGKEAQPETAATRLLWAAGYFTDITYLVPSETISGKGRFENVRFEARKVGNRLDEWQWDNNPFIGTRQLQGLKVMMVLIGNWDIKDSNNKIVQVRNNQGMSELRYLVSDLGATFGKTGGVVSRSRNEPHDYADTRFVDEIRHGFVDFHYNGKRKELFTDITVPQARWIGEILAQLSDDQIRDAFRAANYQPDQVELLTGAVRSRITQLITLPQVEPEFAGKGIIKK